MQNGHPLVVHFPVAFLLVAGLATLAAPLVRGAWLLPFSRVCLYLGTLSAVVAVASGFFAVQTVARVEAADGELAAHQTAGYVTLALAALLSGWSIVAWRRSGRAPRPAALWMLGNAALVAVLVFAAKEGGELVHSHGVGTRLTGPSGPLFEPGHMQHGAGAAATGGVRDSVPTAQDFR